MVTDDKVLLTSYIDLVRVVEDFSYFHVSVAVAKEVFPEIAPGNVILLKDFDEKMAIFKEELTKDKFVGFLNDNMIPTVTEITQKVIEQLFKDKVRKAIFLFRSVKPESDKVEAVFHKVATELKSKDYMFVQTDIKDGWGQRVANFFGIDETMLPCVEHVEMKEELIRYRHTGGIEEKEVKEFIAKAQKGEAARYLKSEPVPETNPGPVFKLVGKKFEEEVIKNDQDVLVKFYAPWCGHCKKLEPIYKSLAESLAQYKTLKFMEIDATKNDVVGHPVQGFPTLMLFLGKDKTKVETYNGDRSEGDLAKFLKEKCSHPIEIPELKTQDEKKKNVDDL